MARILVVDDEAEICSFLRDFLTPRGHKVETARDGPTAIDKIMLLAPEIVLLDIVMPGMDGMKVLKEIRRIDAQLAVVMVTAVGHQEPATKCLELGAFDYITKPVDLDYLENVILVKALDSM